MTDLSNQIALVTGASSGLGKRFAHVLSEAGATVVMAARRLDRLESLARELPGRAVGIAFDAADANAPEALIAEVKATVGMPTLLINNAGISRPGRAHRISAEDFDETMAVNLRAPWRLSTLCASDWIAAKSGGTIINVASILATRVAMGVSVYCMSKAAVRHMTAAHAFEWAEHGIRVNALCPGYIRTEINDSFWDSDLGRAELARFPREQVGTPADLDTALLFLADPRSSFVNGASLTVDDAQSWAV